MTPNQENELPNTSESVGMTIPIAEEKPQNTNAPDASEVQERVGQGAKSIMLSEAEESREDHAKYAEIVGQKPIIAITENICLSDGSAESIISKLKAKNSKPSKNHPFRKAKIGSRFKGLSRERIADLKWFEKFEMNDNQMRLNQMGELGREWQRYGPWQP